MKIKVYIDGSNLYRGLLNSGLPPKIDIPELSKFLARNDSLLGTNYYSSPVDQTVMPEEAKAQQRFFNFLKSVPGTNLKLGRLEKRWTDSGILYYVEKGVDVMIAKDLIVDAIED